MKFTYLENLSTIVRIMDSPPTLGRPSLKSMATSDHTVVHLDDERSAP
jgi:hypothetical protein